MLRKSLAGIVRSGLLGIASLLTLIVVLNFLAHVGLARPQDTLSILTFIQPLWALFLAIIAAAILVFTGRRRLALILAGLASLNCLFHEDYRLISSPSNPAVDPSYPSLKVAAWNVQYFFHGLESVAAELMRTDADVVLLSECTLTPEQQIIFEGLLAPYKLMLSSQGDTALLTRLPILEAHEVYLPSHQASLKTFNRLEDQRQQPRRSFMHASVLFQGQLLHVLSLRFIAGRAASHSLIDQIPWGIYLWKTQLAEVQFFKSYVRSLDGPYIFGGDLNAPPASITMKQLNELGKDAYLQRHHWGDFTFKTKILRQQKEKNMPAMRLDYVFISPSFLVRDIEHKANSLSDHDLVFAELASSRSRRISAAAAL